MIEQEATSHDAFSEEIPAVTSPYAGQTLGVRQHMSISSFWFASNFLWGALLIVMLPSEAKALAEKHHLDRATLLGLTTGLAALVALFVPLVVGALSDRCASKWGRRRPYIAGGVALNIVGLAVFSAGYSNYSIPIFIIGYMLVQFGNNVASAAFNGIIPDLVPDDQRGVASGYMGVMSQVGTLLGSVVVGVALLNAPEGIKITTIAVVLASVSLITLLGIREAPLPSKAPPLQWLPYIKSLWINPKEYPDFAWVWITRALVMMGFYMIVPFVQYYLGDVVRVANPAETAPKLLGGILIGTSISGYVGGAISDRIGRKRVVYLSNLVIAVMTIALIFCDNLLQTMIVGVLFGLGYGAYISVDWALGTDVLPSDKDAAKDMAVWHIAMTLPQSIAGPVAGIILSRFGQRFVFVNGEKIPHYTQAGYAAVFSLAAVCFALGAFLLQNVKKVR
jgi:MFS family permease